MPTRKTAGCDKRAASAAAIIRSVFCTLAKESVDSGKDFANRKRKSEDSKKHCPGKALNKSMLAMIQSFFLDAKDKNELNYCKNVLSNSNHYYYDCKNALINFIEVSDDNPRADNTNIKITGMRLSPLLIGEV